MTTTPVSPSWGSDAELAHRLATVRERISDAASAAGRAAEDITLVAVTKFHDPEIVRALAELGVRDFGENRHPESRLKAEVAHEVADARLHFIGQLQRNKARQVARYADVIESIDREDLVDALAKLEDVTVDVTIQLSIDGDTSRGGVPLPNAEALAERILATPTLRLRGVMTVAPIGMEPEAAFAQAREISERIRTLAPDADWLSMGMSHDFHSAISQGATHLRIGEAITGKRPGAQ
ncbi:YggS family pyridoxal phosphate-dependent enzyme [Gulosibacter sp. ACHW.36C]|uniref:Pyridoxal phosphate homeostasis protein n=1 Tax=Gulosibacter sediminis TaxID=1729695 RepID=A0ABY4MUN6_9MICO|nr:YggS family pyridoxal phosphate-dependent enzyme [Gulosibacter sediminis]UQN13887.1 YggS family pyridoxal phosphate-dependent enzyme [Gulosibacter sediminis]